MIYDNIILTTVITTTTNASGSRESAVATGYGLDGRGFGVRVAVGVRFFFSPRRPD
jgi:hypothetical protein